MTVDEARCPHCESLISGDEIEKLAIEKSGTIAPMGLGPNKNENDVVYVCPSCNTILG